ncbi:MAG TPA: ABC transporter substrate-binding protein, partial [Roseiarcus sp.]|nr:ABC transporter substrate-binding protein [Roseiarcus sp.]
MRKSFRLIIAAGAALLSFSALAAPKDSVTIGMVLEPPGLDPTTGAAAAIGQITHYNIYEG